MEGVVAARRLRKSMLEKDCNVENINFNNMNIFKKEKSNNSINVEEGTKYFRKMKIKYIIKSLIVIIMLIFCLTSKILFKERISNNTIISKIISEYNHDYSKNEILEGFENIIYSIYTNLNYIFPDKIVQIIQNKYIYSVKPYIQEFEFNNFLKQKDYESNVIIYEEKENTQVQIYNESKLKEEAIVDEKKEEELNGVGGGIETIEESSSISSAEEEINEIKKLNIQVEWPTKGTITSKYGVRDEIFKDIGNYHTGLDIANVLGTDIKSATNGKVVKVEQNNKYYGNTIEIDSNGVIFKYAHLSEILVKENAEINLGNLIGKMGSTGYSTGSHLHFEIRYNSKTIDPELLLP